MSGILTALIGAFPTPSTNSYESIATVTVGSAVSTVEFTSIPSTYKHLQIRGSVRNNTSGATTSFAFRLNGTTTTNYAGHRLRGDGTSAGAFADPNDNGISAGQIPAGNATSDVFNGFVIDILDYTNTNKNKTTRSLSGHDQNGSGSIWLNSGLYFANTNAISSIRFYSSIGDFVTNSRFALYGIKG
jgi:hypothetical protein